jgi:methylase of polypeptide subunit release factors
MVMQLYMWGKRITRYRGVCTTWDQAVDKQVWCTNIDTVYFLQQLFDAGVLARQDVRTAMEVGVGGGAIAKTLAVYLAGLHELTVTDISPYALVCAKRNILPVLQDGQRLHLYLGKGIRSIAAQVDLLVVNPPYIPHMQRPDATDPYRGTGLIQEIVDIGVDYLSPANPQAAIYMGMSSLAERDLQTYLAQTERVAVERLGTPKEVPLKILAVNENQEWLAFLEREHGLVRSPKRLKEEGYEFWHTLSVLKLTRCRA